MEQSRSDQQLTELALELVQKLQQREEFPKGAAASEQEIESPDLFSLFSALTALQQEVALQGRSFGKLDQNLALVISHFEKMQTVSENVHRLNENMHQLRSSLESLSSQALSEMRAVGRDEARNEQFDRLIDPLLDTHDQMRRLVEQYKVRLYREKGWRQWFGHRKLLQDTLQTQSICETKIRQKLESLGVTLTAFIDKQFDPKSMKAVELEYQSGKSSGIVLEIYRQGYKLEDRVLRFAEVKVSGRKEQEHNQV